MPGRRSLKKSNTLEIGKPRLGWIVLESGLRSPALLEKDEHGIFVDMLGLDEENAEISNGLYNLDKRETPKNLLFWDVAGFVELTDCAESSYNYTIGSGPRIKRVIAARAILGSDGRASQSIVGLRSLNRTLDTWIFRENITRYYPDSNETNKSWIQYEMAEIETIDLPGFSDLKILTYPTAENGLDRGAVLKSRTEIRSMNGDSFDLTEAENKHLGLLKLLTVLIGRKVEQSLHYLGSDSPVILFGGTEKDLGTQWFEISSGYPNQSSQEANFHDFLISYDAVEAAGISKWLALYKKHEDGLSALVRAIEAPETSWEGRLVDICIAFEKIGAVLRENPSAKFHDCIKSVCLDTPPLIHLHPEIWADHLRLAYRGLKHAGRDSPPLEEIIKLTLVGINVLTLWVIEQIAGVQKIANDKFRNLQLFYPWFHPGDDVENYVQWELEH